MATHEEAGVSKKQKSDFEIELYPEDLLVLNWTLFSTIVNIYWDYAKPNEEYGLFIK